MIKLFKRSEIADRISKLELDELIELNTLTDNLPVVTKAESETQYIVVASEWFRQRDRAKLVSRQPQKAVRRARR